MKQFVTFLTVVFAGLFLFYLYRDDSKKNQDFTTVKVYASSSFIKSWGPGPELKSLFEKQTGYRVVYLEMPEPSMLFQKMKFDGANSIADVVVGLDQFDIIRSSSEIKWKKIESNWPESFLDIKDNFKSADFSFFVPYDWAPMAFVSRSSLKTHLASLDDLLKPELKTQIALEDPRTSSPGLQLLFWIMRSYPEPEAIEYLKKLSQQAHSISPNWSTAYGLFKSEKARLVFSYVTSPVYHLIEEKDDTYRAAEFKNGHPVQVEFAGVPDTCKNCDAAIQFVEFIQSLPAQRIIMNKNYMFPVINSVKESTAFDSVKIYKPLKAALPDKNELVKWINLWVEVVKNEG